MLIISLILQQFLSPHNITVGLSVINEMHFNFIDRKQIKRLLMSQLNITEIASDAFIKNNVKLLNTWSMRVVTKSLSPECNVMYDK